MWTRFIDLIIQTMAIGKRRECKALCEKDRRNKIASQISLIAQVVPQDLLPAGFSQKDVLIAAHKFILSVTSSNLHFSKNGQMVFEPVASSSGTYSKLPKSATHVTYVISSETPPKPTQCDQFSQTDSTEPVNSCASQQNYVIMVQPTVLMDSFSKKRKLDAKPFAATQLLPKPSSSVSEPNDILSQATAAILSENQETQTDAWPVPPEVNSMCIQTESITNVTQEMACQTTTVSSTENFQDIVEMVEEANQRQAESQFNHRHKQPSGTGLRVEQLLAPSYERPTQQQVDPYSQRSNLWSQYPTFTMPPINAQQQQTTAAPANSAPGDAHSTLRTNAQAQPPNIHQGSNRFTVDFSVAGVLRTNDALPPVDQRSKLSHYANAERHSQRPSPAQKQTNKRQAAQSRRQQSDKPSTSCPQASTFVQPGYYPIPHHQPPLDATGERVDLSEDIFDCTGAAQSMESNTNPNTWGWYPRSSQATAPQFWPTNNSNTGYTYPVPNANINWCPPPSQTTAMSSSAVTPQQQQRQTSNNNSGREKTHNFHIAHMLTEISPNPMQHEQQQQQQPDNQENARQQDSSRRSMQQTHASQQQYWSADYMSHGFGRPAYDMNATNSYYHRDAVDGSFMPRFNL